MRRGLIKIQHVSNSYSQMSEKNEGDTGCV